MKLPKPDIHTSTLGHIKEESFGLSEENMGMIFDILRNKMYSNPIGSIAREIACNSRDAHKEVGKESQPIEIFLPTQWEPTIKFQDFGPGISPERMTNVFLKYTASTKRADNEQIGGFGIGAKTPFAYTDSFTIVTVVDGMERHYHAYIDETQIGKMALAREVETDAPNGTTIVVPVDKYDCKNFCKEVVNATQYWDLKPILHRDECWTYAEYEKLYEGNNWYLIKEKRDRYGYGNESKAQVLISGVPYPIEPASITDIDPLAKDAASNPYVLTFDIGELSLIASRERIHYDEKTQAVLSDRLKKVAEDFIAVVKKEIDAAEDYCAARKVLSSYSNVLRGGNIVKALQELGWQGHKLLDKITAADIGERASIRTYIWKTARNGIQAIRSPSNAGRTSLCVDEPNALIYLNDRKAKSVPRAYADKIWEENPDLKKLQIILAPATDHAGTKIKYNTDLLDLIGTKKLSSVTPNKKARAKSGDRYKKEVKTNVTAYELRGWRDIEWDLKEVPNEDGGTYVIVDHSISWKAGKFVTSLKNFYSNFNIYKDFIGGPIYGFTPTRAKKLSKKWKKVEDVVKEKMDKLEKKLDINAIKNLYKASYFIFTHHISSVSMPSALKDIKDKDSVIKRYYNESKAIETVIEKYTKYVDILTLLGKVKDGELTPCTSSYYTDMKKKDTSGLKDLLLEYKKRYPMLAHIERYRSDKAHKAIVDYINQMDSMARMQAAVSKVAKKSTKLAKSA